MTEMTSPSLPKIVVQKLQMELPFGSMDFSEDLLSGEVADMTIKHRAYVGPAERTLKLSDGAVDMFLIITGNGELLTKTVKQCLSPESLAIPMTTTSQVQFKVCEAEVLHFVQFTRTLSSQDVEDLKNFPKENKYDLFFTRFADCVPYTEKIKSSNTVSRTVLPADIVPRVSLGTVEAMGPDKVGAHEHPMLDQLFLGLSDNDIRVHADGASTALKSYSLLHIPIGSSHWVSVEEHKKMHYLWMDFFLTKAGEEWLKTHKPIQAGKNV